MNYTAKQILSAIKKYPENRPRDADIYLVYYIDSGWGFNQWGSGWADLSRIVWFLDIPGAPEEVRPRKYPDEKPKREAFYICHNKISNEWTSYRWNNEIDGFWMFESEDQFYAVGFGAVDYFINIPLEKEKTEEVWNTANLLVELMGDGYVYIEAREDGVNEYELTQFCEEWLQRRRYHILKRTPEIAPCPNCGKIPWLHFNAMCGNWYACSCGVSGPAASTEYEALAGYNLVARKK